MTAATSVSILARRTPRRRWRAQPTPDPVSWRQPKEGVVSLMRLHATSVARDGRALVLLGPSGIGKSDLALRLIDRGFELVADDQTLVDGLIASPPPELAGLIEVRGLGILRVPYRRSATMALALDLASEPDRHPIAAVAAFAPVPLIGFDGRSASAPLRAAIAFDCATGARTLASGAIGSPSRGGDVT